jgi:hypothetical protein
MADTTTVRVRTSTRGLVLQIGASRRQSADQVILAALAAMQRDERRQVAAAAARAIKDDPADRAEVRAIQHDTPALHGGVRSTDCHREARTTSRRAASMPWWCSRTGHTQHVDRRLHQHQRT